MAACLLPFFHRGAPHATRVRTSIPGQVEDEPSPHRDGAHFRSRNVPRAHADICRLLLQLFMFIVERGLHVLFTLSSPKFPDLECKEGEEGRRARHYNQMRALLTKDNGLQFDAEVLERIGVQPDLDAKELEPHLYQRAFDVQKQVSWSAFSSDESDVVSESCGLDTWVLSSSKLDGVDDVYKRARLDHVSEVARVDVWVQWRGDGICLSERRCPRMRMLTNFFVFTIGSLGGQRFWTGLMTCSASRQMLYALMTVGLGCVKSALSG